MRPDVVAFMISQAASSAVDHPRLSNNGGMSTARYVNM